MEAKCLDLYDGEMGRGSQCLNPRLGAASVSTEGSTMGSTLFIATVLALLC